MGDRIVVMLDGVIQQVASPLELYHKPVNKFVAGFIGSPPMNMVTGALHAENGEVRFRGEHGVFDVSVAPQHREALDKYIGKPIIFGIRPEDIHENAAQEPADGLSFSANVDVVEPMGANINLYLDVGGHQTVTACIKSDEEPEVNKHHVLDLAMENAHYFDPDSELAVV